LGVGLGADDPTPENFIAPLEKKKKKKTAAAATM
jgi:hypothetical protein